MPVEVWSTVVAAVAVVIGWIVVHRLSAARDIDKARRELVAKSADELVKDVNELFSTARLYHTAERHAAQELKLKMGLQDLSMRLVGLGDVCHDLVALAQCRAEVTSLRKAITGQHFEDEHALPLDDNALQLQAIASSVFSLKRSLFRVKHLQFAVAKKPLA